MELCNGLLYLTSLLLNSSFRSLLRIVIGFLSRLCLQLSVSAHTRPVMTVLFSPNGDKLLSCSPLEPLAESSGLKLWDAQTGNLLFVFKASVGELQRVSSLREEYLAPVPTSTQAPRIQTLLDSQTTCCNFSPDGTIVISGHRDGSLKLWSISTGLFHHALEGNDVLAGHSSRITFCHFSPQGKFILSASQSNLVLHDAATFKLKRVFRGHTDLVASACFSSDGTTVVSGSHDKTLKVWQPSGLQHTFTGHSGPIDGCLSRGGIVLSWCYHSDNVPRLWCLKTGLLLHVLEGHYQTIHRCVFSPDGDLVISASRDRSLKIWDAKSGHRLHTLLGHAAYVTGCAFDRNVLVSLSEDKSVVIWNPATGSLKQRLEKGSSYINDFALHPQGRSVVCGRQDGTIDIWG